MSFHSIIAGYLGYDVSIESESIGYTALLLSISWWIYEDAKKQEYWGAQQAGAFIIYLWPIILPIYLFQTRRWKGLMILIGILTLIIMPWTLGWIAYYLNPSNG